MTRATRRHYPPTAMLIIVLLASPMPCTIPREITLGVPRNVPTVGGSTDAPLFASANDATRFLQPQAPLSPEERLARAVARVPRGTRAAVRGVETFEPRMPERNCPCPQPPAQLLYHVRIIEGPHEGKEGWVIDSYTYVTEQNEH